MEQSPTHTPQQVRGADIVFSGCPVPCLDDTQEAHLYVGSVEEGTVTRITSGPVIAHSPAWSPDGSKIAFVMGQEFTTDDPSAELYVMDADGSNIVQVTGGENLVQAESPAWSPDGDTIAFARGRVPKFEIYLISSDGSGLRRPGDNGQQGEDFPAFSPDGTQIAFTVGAAGDGGKLMVMDADGSNRRALVASKTNQSPAWSPDGDTIVFSRFVNDEQGWNLFTVRRDGSELTRITRADADAATEDNRSPSFSPDGKWIVFSRAGEIFRIRLDGTELRRLFADARISYHSPSWRP